jgi:hypothetical protein
METTLYEANVSSLNLPSPFVWIYKKKIKKNVTETIHVPKQLI